MEADNITRPDVTALFKALQTMKKAESNFFAALVERYGEEAGAAEYEKQQEAFKGAEYAILQEIAEAAGENITAA